MVEQTRDHSGDLTEDEVQLLMLAVGRGQETFSEEDAQRAIEWAEGVRMQLGLLDAVLNGDLAINNEGDEIAFRITQQGAERVEAMGVAP